MTGQTAWVQSKDVRKFMFSSLQRSALLFCDSSFKISSTFERTKLQDFDVCHAHPHPHSSGFYGKIEQKTTRQDLSIPLWQCLKELLCPLD